MNNIAFFGFSRSISGPPKRRPKIEKPPKKINKYIQEKGYLAIDGISLTVGEVSEEGFNLHLIPETLAITTIGTKSVGERVNIEVDSMTQTIVTTVERILEGR